MVKALILGADATSVGRLYVYGLAAAGAEGMVRLFEILEDEIRCEHVYSRSRSIATRGVSAGGIG